MTTQLGIPVGNGQDSLKLGKRGPTLLEDFQFREKIFQLTTSGFLSVSYMLADLVRMASMKTTRHLPMLRKPTFSSGPEKRRLPSYDFRLLPEALVRLTSLVMCADSQSNFIHSRVTGTLSEITNLYF